MTPRLTKLQNLLWSPNRLDRIFSLVEMKAAIRSQRPAPVDNVTTLDEFRVRIGSTHSELSDLLTPCGEAAEALRNARAYFHRLAIDGRLPFPEFFNADACFGTICYALTRYIKPLHVIESGVGYGVSSSLILEALKKNGRGRLTSIDLPPLSDPSGTFTGFAVPDHLRGRWTLYRNLSSRKGLPGILQAGETIDLFISDSANIYTVQRFELSRIWPRLSSNGFAVFNSSSSKLISFAETLPSAAVYNIWLVEKVGLVTTIVEKR